MKEPKPILVIKVPSNYTTQDYDSFTAGINKMPIGKDYHVLVIQNSKVEDISIEVFYSKDFKQTDFEQLEKMIKESWNHSSKKSNEDLLCPECGSYVKEKHSGVECGNPDCSYFSCL